MLYGFCLATAPTYSVMFATYSLIPEIEDLLNRVFGCLVLIVVFVLLLCVADKFDQWCERIVVAKQKKQDEVHRKQWDIECQLRRRQEELAAIRQLADAEEQRRMEEDRLRIEEERRKEKEAEAALEQRRQALLRWLSGEFKDQINRECAGKTSEEVQAKVKTPLYKIAKEYSFDFSCLDAFEICAHLHYHFRDPMHVLATKPAHGVAVGKVRSINWCTLAKGDAVLYEEDRRMPTYGIGRTGAGKTNLVLSLVEHSIQCKCTTVVFDLRGDLVDRLLRRLYRSKDNSVEPEFLWRYDDFRIRLLQRLCVIDFRCDSQVIGLNPLVGEGEVYGRVHAVLDIIRSRSESWGVQIEYILRLALVAIAQFGGSLVDISPFFADAEFRCRVLSKCDNEEATLYFARFNAMNQEAQTQLVMPILNKIAPFLAFPRMRNALGSPKPLDWRKLLDDQRGNIVLISLAGDVMHSASGAMGSLMLAQVKNAIFSRTDIPEEERQPVHCYVDEFENFASHALLPLIVEGRRFGVSFNLFHQTCSQLDKALLEAIQNNCHVQFLFGTGSIDARTMGREIKRYCDDPVQELTGLRAGQAFFVVRGNGVCKIQTPLAVDPHVSEKRMAILRDASNAQYALPSSEVETYLTNRTKVTDPHFPDDFGGGFKHGKKPEI